MAVSLVCIRLTYCGIFAVARKRNSPEFFRDLLDESV